MFEKRMSQFYIIKMEVVKNLIKILTTPLSCSPQYYFTIMQ